MFFYPPLLLETTLPSISAQYINNNPIGSCVDVHCPSQAEREMRPECRVTNHTYFTIGLTSFSTNITSDNLDLDRRDTVSREHRRR